jgi:hypothetical protein
VGDNQGRIVRFSGESDARQLLTPAAAANPIDEAAMTSLASAEDMAIDELSGALFWVANGEIWQAKLPLA